MRLSCVKRWVGLLLALVASPVLAGSDTFYLGSGRDGVLEVSQPDTRINRYAQVKAPLATGDLSIQVDSAEGFAAGDLVMVLQTTGLVPAAVPGHVAPMDLSHDAVGRWELARLASVDGAVLSLTSALLSSYAAEVSQVIRVPELTSVHVQPGASLVAQPWNGATGGVIAFLATGTLLNEGRIDASGMGFRGGSPTWEETGCSSAGSTGEGVDSTAHGRASGPENVANGGGGGTCRGRAGGGGGNASAGGQAGQQPWSAGGMGGAPLAYSMLDHLTLGGGGGGGYVRGAQLENEAQGGRGGGAIFIRAGALDGNGAISASGDVGGFSVSEGPGGGGAGGSILVRLAGSMRCGGLHAEGGRGGASLGSAEPVSGGGGGGRVLYQASLVTGCPAFAGAWLSDSWSEAPEASGEDSVTTLPGGLMRPEPATILWPGNGSTVETARPSIVGRATSGMEVIVYLDGAETGRVIASDGVFSFTPDQFLTAGKHTVQAETFYQGLKSERSSLHVFVTKLLVGSSGDVSSMGLKAPTVITIDGKLADGVDLKPTYVRSLRPLFFGESDPSTTVTVKIFEYPISVGANPIQIFKATAIDAKPCTNSSCDWEWSANPYKDLPARDYLVKVNTGDLTPEKSYLLTVDRTPPAPPTVDSPAQLINDDTPRIKGSFTEQVEVFLSIDGVMKAPLGVVSRNGRWEFDLTEWTPALSAGAHSLVVMGSDSAGNTVSKSVAFTVDRTPPVPVVTYLNNVPVPDASAVIKINTTNPSIRGTVEPNSTVVVQVTGSSTPAGSATADTNGAWQIASSAMAGLPLGPATLSITATDLAGNPSVVVTQVQYLVDRTAPSLTVTSVGSKTAGLTTGNTLNINLKRPVINGTLNEPGKVTVTLTSVGDASDTQTLVAASPSGVTGSWGWSVDPTRDLSNADYTLRIIVADDVGNSTGATPYTLTLRIDWDPPETTRTVCPTQVGASAPYRFEFTSDESPGVTFQCNRDGAGYSTCPTPHLISETLSVGEHYLLVRAVDAAGNVDDTPIACFWNVSSEDFTIFIRDPPATLSSSSTASFRLESNRAAPAYQCQLQKNGTTVADWDDCVFTAGRIVYTGLTDGLYTLNVEGTAGASERDTDSWTWTVDLNAPAPTSITLPDRDDLYLNSATPRLAGSGSALATDRPGEEFFVQIYLDGAPSPFEFALPSDKKWQYTLPRLDEGVHFVFVNIRDKANNQSTQVKRTFYVDTLPPETDFASGLPDKLTREPVATFSFMSPTDATSISYECVLDDEPAFRPCDPSGAASRSVGPFTGDRAHTLLVRAKDLAGNYDPTPAQYTWRVDTVLPDTFIESGPPALTNSTSASFVFKSEPGSSFLCSLDGVLPFEPCPSDAYTGLSDGPHVLKVQARDEATNLDGTPAEYRWFVDQTSPEAPGITSPEVDAVLSKGFPEVRGTAEAGSKVDVYLDATLVGSATTNDLGSWKVAVELSVTDGQYELEAWSTDVAGNKSRTPATRTVMVDATAPDTAILEGPSGRIRETRASFQFNASESDSSFECSLDFGEFEPCQATMEYEVPAGEHTLRVRALDRVKNPDPTPASRVWQVYLGGDSKVIGGGLSCSTTTGGSSVLATLWLLGLAAFSARRSRR